MLEQLTGQEGLEINQPSQDRQMQAFEEQQQPNDDQQREELPEQPMQIDEEQQQEENQEDGVPANDIAQEWSIRNEEGLLSQLDIQAANSCGINLISVNFS